MRKWSGFGLVLLLLAGPAFAAAPKGNTVMDLWEAAYLPTGKAGYFRLHVVEIERDGQKLLRSTLEMSLTLRRFNNVIKLRAETGTEETLEGKVTGVFMRQYLGKKQQLHLVGNVKGKDLHLKNVGKGPLLKAPWNDKVISLYRQRLLFKERKVKPGDAFSYLSFEPSINLVVTNRVVVKDYEEIKIPWTKEKARLLKVEITPDEIKSVRSDGKVDKLQLPPMYAWLGKDMAPARSQMEAPGLGKINSYPTTQLRALAPGNAVTGGNDTLGLGQMIVLNERIARPLNTKSAVYRITVKGDKDAASAFTQDGRQTIKNAEGSTFELHVTASRGPRKGKASGDNQKQESVNEEFLKSSYFINCDDVKVKEHARKAAGKETDPWRKALRVEKWVKRHMKVTFDEELATADHVARTLEGDCTEHAMLAAAMCRAVGVPSRTAIGMVYADTRKGPGMIFHMWTEVWVQGQWVPIDGTLGRGYVGATHIKITDQSWHDTRTLTPLLPFLRVVGKLSIEVVSASNAPVFRLRFRASRSARVS